MLMKSARATGVIIGIFAVFVLLMAVSLRHSLLYWAMLSLAVLPVIAWRDRALGPSFLVAIAVAASLAASPIDLVFRPGAAGLRFLPAMHGLACREGFACYGCLGSLHDARYAVIVSF
jgi:hypothetical protein